MKRNAIKRFGIPLLAACLLAGCTAAQETKPEIIKKYEDIPMKQQMVEVIGPVIHDLSDIEEGADFIVQGYLLDDAEMYFRPPAPKSLYDVVSGATVSTLKITRVWKGDLKKGDTVKLSESFYTFDIPAGTYLYYFLGYLPSDVGREYVFFLNRQPEDAEWMPGIYKVYCAENGRYAVPETHLRIQDIYAMTNEELGIGHVNPDLYMELYHQAIEKYLG